MITQTPWLERTFNFDFPVTNFPVIYSRLEGNILRLEKMLEHASEEATCRRDDGWCIKEQVGHLTDMEALWWKRLEDFKDGKVTLAAADMSNEKTRAAKHKERPLGDLLHDFRIERTMILDSIYHFDAEMLSRTAIHPRLKTPMRVVDSLYFVAEHDDHHICTISMLLRLFK
jgi:uncharacterized damage-inducible protein DinB